MTTLTKQVTTNDSRVLTSEIIGFYISICDAMVESDCDRDSILCKERYDSITNAFFLHKEIIKHKINSDVFNNESIKLIVNTIISLLPSKLFYKEIALLSEKALSIIASL